jgi:predicted anti-sigma-YlaC factor YlaD
MNCAELYDRLTDLAEGTLQADVSAEVQRHLAECADCRQVRQDLEDLARLCRGSAATATTMPSAVRLRIEALLVTDEGGPTPPRRPTA